MTNELPIDFDQLNMVSNNDPYDREFLVSIYLRETEKDLKSLRHAIQAGETKEVYRISHSCAGSSRSYGMCAVVPALKQMETESRAGDLRNAENLFLEIQTQFQRIKTFALTLPTFQEEQSKAA
jgi:HPt (histidine-containing phosphotransfer) domain-containing protein